MFTETTTLRHSRIRALTAFRVTANIGCVVLWKPWFGAIGAERWERSGALYLGPLAVGFGPIDANLTLRGRPIERKDVAGRSRDPVEAHGSIKAESDDPDTQTMAVLVLADGTEIATTNTLTEGVSRAPERLARPAKYTWIEHSERNAIFEAARRGLATRSASLHIEWYPCADCARAIAQSGISTLHCGPRPDDDGRYGFAAAEAILSEGGVEIRERGHG